MNKPILHQLFQKETNGGNGPTPPPTEQHEPWVPEDQIKRERPGSIRSTLIYCFLKFADIVTGRRVFK